MRSLQAAATGGRLRAHLNITLLVCGIIFTLNEFIIFFLYLNFKMKKINKIKTLDFDPPPTYWSTGIFFFVFDGHFSPFIFFFIQCKLFLPKKKCLNVPKSNGNGGLLRGGASYASVVVRLVSCALGGSLRSIQIQFKRNKWRTGSGSCMSISVSALVSEKKQNSNFFSFFFSNSPPGIIPRNFSLSVLWLSISL